MLEVGQKVWVKKTGNSARWCKPENLITEETIESIGHKYFTLVNYVKIKFSIEKMYDVSEYSSEYSVYESLQEIKDESERYGLAHYLNNYSFNSVSLEKLRIIKNELSK